MSESPYAVISKFVVQNYPAIFEDTKTNAEVTKALSKIIGALVARVYVKNGEKYYGDALRLILQEIDNEARGVAKLTQEIIRQEADATRNKPS